MNAASLWQKYNDPASRTNEAIRELLAYYETWISESAGRYYKKYGKHLSFDEIRTEVENAAVAAMLRYNPSEGVKFETYASHRCCGAVQDLCRGLDFVSYGYRRSGVTVQHVSLDALTQENDEDHIPAELADQELLSLTGEISPEFWQRLYSIIYHRSNKLWFVLNTVYRLHWTQRQTAKFLGLHESRISQMLREVGEILKQSRALKLYMEGQPNRRTNKKGMGAVFAIRNRGHLCIEEGCQREARRHGRCRLHHYLQPGVYKKCSTEGCSRPQTAKGLCDICQQKVRRPFLHKPCAIPTCKSLAQKRGLCTTHYKQFKMGVLYEKTGVSPESFQRAWDHRPSGGFRCVVEGNERHEEAHVRDDGRGVCTTGCGVPDVSVRPRCDVECAGASV